MNSSFRDTLYGIAVADAIGNPLEFRAHVTPQDFLHAMAQHVLRISDDTQMTLFCTEALLNALQTRGEVTKQDLEAGYHRWYQTQISRTPQGEGLLQFRFLYSVEAPGKTCRQSLQTLLAGQKVHNDSKGNGTVMRAAPFAFVARQFDKPDEWALSIAAMDARITHRHPNAAGASVQLTAIYLQLLKGQKLAPAILQAVEAMRGRVPGDITQACRHALEGNASLNAMQGWIAEEALALAIRAVLAGTDYLSVIQEACCFGEGCDSDSIAGIAGGLAAGGGWIVPDELVAKLNALDAIDYVVSLFPCRIHIH